MANRNLDRVLSSNFLDNLEGWTIEQVREARADCQTLEDAASFLRRLLQTRIDIIDCELRSCRGDSSQNIVAKLNQVLTDARSKGAGRLLTSEPRADHQLWAERRIAEAAQGNDVERLAQLDTAELEAVAERFIELERQVSTERRSLHDVYDKLQGEVIERYRSGRASVDGLLNSIQNPA